MPPRSVYLGILFIERALLCSSSETYSAGKALGPSSLFNLCGFRGSAVHTLCV